jgi:hypothetical protein
MICEPTGIDGVGMFVLMNFGFVNPILISFLVTAWFAPA